MKLVIDRTEYVDLKNIMADIKHYSTVSGLLTGAIYGSLKFKPENVSVKYDGTVYPIMTSGECSDNAKIVIDHVAKLPKPVRMTDSKKMIISFFRKNIAAETELFVDLDGDN